MIPSDMSARTIPVCERLSGPASAGQQKADLHNGRRPGRRARPITRDRHGKRPSHCATQTADSRRPTSRRFAATSTRACESSTAATTMSLVLAAAGLLRLGFASRISMTLPATACVPAPGQGIVAIEIRDGDEDVRRVVGRIDDAAAAAALSAERALVAALGGGCQTPIGALASPVDDSRARRSSPSSCRPTAAVPCAARRAGRLIARPSWANEVAAQLVEEGADDILAEVSQSSVGRRPQQSSVIDCRTVARASIGPTGHCAQSRCSPATTTLRPTSSSPPALSLAAFPIILID